MVGPQNHQKTFKTCHIGSRSRSLRMRHSQLSGFAVHHNSTQGGHMVRNNAREIQDGCHS